MAPKSEPPTLTEKLSPDEAGQVQQKLDETVHYAIAGGRDEERAAQTRKRAKESKSAKEKTALKKEAKQLDGQSKQQLKTTQRLQSGGWQGGAAGAGIGAGSAAAVGSATGILAGGVLAIPTTVLGGLVGSGVGGIHGPWVKLTRGDAGPEVKEAKPKEPGAIQLSPKDLDPTLSSADGASSKLEGGKELASQGKQAIGSGLSNSAGKLTGKSEQEKTKSPVKNKSKSGKKPRKLEVRNQGASKTKSS